jgi:protein involved in temperature-dependent protein secretion
MEYKLHFPEAFEVHRSPEQSARLFVQLVTSEWVRPEVFEVRRSPEQSARLFVQLVTSEWVRPEVFEVRRSPEQYRPQAVTRRNRRPECGRVRGGYYSGRLQLGAPF